MIRHNGSQRNVLPPFFIVGCGLVPAGGNSEEGVPSGSGLACDELQQSATWSIKSRTTATSVDVIMSKTTAKSDVIMSKTTVLRRHAADQGTWRHFEGHK